MAYGVRQVPQNIMSVEFKIFDFMTLKQFGISVVLLLVCFALFSFLPTPWSIVIPLFIIIIGGIVLFVPFNGEPFQEFISSYMEAMISPQRRIWHKKGIVLKSAAEKAKYYRYGNDGPDTEKISNFTFFDRFTKKTAEQDKLDKDEEKFLESKDTTKGYKPPVKHTVGNPNIENNGTVVSQKSIHNTADISNIITHQNNQPSHNSMPTTQSNRIQPIVSPQPNFIKQEYNTQPAATHQPQLTPEQEETAVRNFIFGSVEGYEEKPIARAALILKNEKDETLEVFYTNSIGEFKSNYEYIAGKYKIFVNADAKDFNEVVIDHNPIDPVPILILPRDYKQKLVQKQEEDVMAVTDSTDDEIFTGAYDSNIFNLGQGYLEEQPSQVQSPSPVNPPIQSQQDINYLASETPEANIGASNQTIPVTSPSADLINKSSTYSHNAGNMFDQMMNNRMTNDYGATQQSSVSNDIQHTAASHQKIVNDVDFLDFNSMANAAVPFEQNLVSLPNTINGILVDPNGYGLAEALIRIYDQNGVLITSMNSDNTGRFYTYSPLPNNNYIIYISKNNQNLVGFNVNLNGNIIPPKIISFTY